jgi:hypothetical protein
MLPHFLFITYVSLLCNVVGRYGLFVACMPYFRTFVTRSVLPCDAAAAAYPTLAIEVGERGTMGAAAAGGGDLLVALCGHTLLLLDVLSLNVLSGR